MSEQKEKTLGDFICGSLLESLRDGIPDDILDGIPECPYCGAPLPSNKSFCNDQCEYEFFREDDLVEKIEEKEGRN